MTPRTLIPLVILIAGGGAVLAAVIALNLTGAAIDEGRVPADAMGPYFVLLGVGALDVAVSGGWLVIRSLTR